MLKRMSALSIKKGRDILLSKAIHMPIQGAHVRQNFAQSFEQGTEVHGQHLKSDTQEATEYRDSNFKNVMQAVGKNKRSLSDLKKEDIFSSNSKLVNDIESFKRGRRVDRVDKPYRKRGESPDSSSRIVAMPVIASNFHDLFKSNKILNDFNFVLGGGAALALKYIDKGRDGHPSDNIRDIDYDVQLKSHLPKEEEDRHLSPEGLDAIKQVILEELLKKKDSDFFKNFQPDKTTVTKNNTIIFQAGDIEYSFHLIGREKNLSFDEHTVDGGSFNLISRDSHWEMAKPSLEARLKRKDKIRKAFMDTFVLMEGDGDAQEIVNIISAPILDVSLAQDILSKLFGKKPINGLASDLAISNFKTLRKEYKREKTSGPMQDSKIGEFYKAMVNIVVADINTSAAGSQNWTLAENAAKVMRTFSEMQVEKVSPQVPQNITLGSPTADDFHFATPDAPT